MEGLGGKMFRVKVMIWLENHNFCYNLVPRTFPFSLGKVLGTSLPDSLHLTDLARGFGYTVFGALFIQVYGILGHNSGVKYLVFPGF